MDTQNNIHNSTTIIYLWSNNSIKLNFKGGHKKMAEYTSIRIRKDLSEKMQLIKAQNNYKSINELLDKTLDKTINEKLEVIQEQALFYVVKHQ